MENSSQEGQCGGLVYRKSFQGVEMSRVPLIRFRFGYNKKLLGAFSKGEVKAETVPVSQAKIAVPIEAKQIPFGKSQNPKRDIPHLYLSTQVIADDFLIFCNSLNCSYFP
jgi:hypothetical protein